MNKNSTSEQKIKLDLKDNLAIDRTNLANERTFLAYFRSFVVMLSSGFAVLKLEIFQNLIANAIKFRKKRNP